ncbi:MAG TPA: sigma-70 family RNA polymerase sigma factor, partial [Gemmata sp.]|nr:sigma-70 family RNA polymerase sigma factor [Gemmata sp.]
MTRTVVQILGRGDLADLARADRTDGQLVDLFARGCDPEAFAALVRRHGPMVLGVCRRVLRNAADADDAFQAAFLVLARKAAAIGRRELLANWLHGVAYNAARKLRHSIARRALREQPLDGLPEPAGAVDPDAGHDLAALLDEELARLPDHYRTAIVVCDLEGATRREAARRLGWPEGTVARRLARARAMLAAHLAARGVAVPAGLLAAVLTDRPTAAAVVYPNLLNAVATGQVAPRVADTTERVVHAMLIQKLKPAGLILAMCGLALATIAGVAHLSANVQPAAKSADPPAGVPAAQDGAKVAVAIPLRKNDAKETADVLRSLFKTLTVVPARGENTLVLYDT